MHQGIALPSMCNAYCGGPCLVIHAGDVAIPHSVFVVKVVLEAFSKVPYVVLGWCSVVKVLSWKWPEEVVGRRQRVQVASRHVLSVLFHTGSVARSFIRKFIARDTCVCFHLLEVDVMRAAAYDVDNAVYERLVFAVLHPCRSMQHVSNLV